MPPGSDCSFRSMWGASVTGWSDTKAPSGNASGRGPVSGENAATAFPRQSRDGSGGFHVVGILGAYWDSDFRSHRVDTELRYGKIVKSHAENHLSATVFVNLQKNGMTRMLVR
jgi:hypothetical protein